ncbi:MAG: DUF1501 domain-containing protein [Proteobacteria bacterium]|nr:DUF1501 domain-containing protein [Pseudomonadota bacterium]
MALASKQALAKAGKSDSDINCILIWTRGGTSHHDTFDPKPDHENGGEFKPISTSVPGIQIGEHFPKLAKLMKHVAIVRSMSTKEGEHSRGTYLMRTGYLPQGPIKYPAIGSLLSKETTEHRRRLTAPLSAKRFLP